MKELSLFDKVKKDWMRNKSLYIMVLPVLIFFILFHYFIVIWSVQYIILTVLFFFWYINFYFSLFVFDIFFFGDVVI